MIPVKFDQAYLKDLGAGDNPGTGDLPRCVCLDRQVPGVCAVLSCWAPSPAELEAILRDGRVYLAVMAPLSAPTQAPVWVMGINPIDSGQFTVVPAEDLKHLAE